MGILNRAHLIGVTIKGISPAKSPKQVQLGLAPLDDSFKMRNESTL